ncbi:c-type cytochrome [Neolewinella antarctica]|uniref:Mono/diheme cytochrome c family protein n=1 Tax=Neolewinella antarctica TaxID=442734 RepID=A0ABX0XFD1_9BACT|nr:cytochrome c [Neolewinella antarctica]NJC28020.1 mono/diheme cytochrome c family protein [Neolewinella antarctica]
MKQLITLLFLAFIIVACGGGEDAPSEAPLASANKVEAKEINVKKIWKVRCIACHGIDGTMGTNGAANLKLSDKDMDYRVNIIKNGSENGVMTAFGEILDEDEVKAMAQFTMDLRED